MFNVSDVLNETSWMHDLEKLRANPDDVSVRDRLTAHDKALREQVKALTRWNKRQGETIAELRGRMW